MTILETGAMSTQEPSVPTGAGAEIPEHFGNIRHLPWLPIIDSTGHRLVGLDEAFTDAHRIERIDVRTPIERAGVLRFLTTVTALVARGQGLNPTNAEAAAHTGFTTEAVDAALGAIDERLWLIHETTPFMQEGRYAAASSVAKTAASIRSTSPGDSSKAWWRRPGDGFATGHLTLHDAPAALMGFWFYSGNGNGAVALDGVKVPQQGSAPGKVIAAGVRLWKTGENLAATLLMNTPHAWVTGHALPAWAQSLSMSGQLDPIIAGTITGNATLLLPEMVQGTILFTGAQIGGALRNGIPAAAADNADLRAAKARIKATVAANKILATTDQPPMPTETLPLTSVDALKASLVDAWQADPQVVIRNPDPKKKGPQKSGDIRALKGVNAGTSVLQNLGAWYLRAFNPDVPGPMNILTRRTFGVELFSLELKQKGSYGELSGASWLSMPTGTIGGSPQAQKALTKFAEYACERVERALYVAVRTVLGKDPATAATSDFAFARFSTLADEVITEVIARAVAGEMFTAEQVHAWSRAAVTAFDDAVEPYVNARRLPDIAQARRTLFQAINRTERE